MKQKIMMNKMFGNLGEENINVEYMEKQNIVPNNTNRVGFNFVAQNLSSVEINHFSINIVFIHKLLPYNINGFQCLLAN